MSNKKRILFTHDVLSHFLGRVSRQAAKIVHPSQASAQSKLNRRNHAKQIQLQKRQSLLSAVRIFGGIDGAPRVVAAVPLCEGVTSRDVVSELFPILGTSYPNGSGVYLENQVRRPAFSLLRVFSFLMSFLRRVERFKSSLQSHSASLWRLLCRSRMLVKSS